MAAYSFIDNINDFFSTGYFTEDFQKKVFDKSGYTPEGIKELNSKFASLRQQYYRYKQAVTSRYARSKDKERSTHDFNTLLLKSLGYHNAAASDKPMAELALPTGENGATQAVPVRLVLNRTDGTPQLYVMDLPTLVSTDDGADATGFAESGLAKTVTHMFSLPEQEHPRYILMLAGNIVFFMDSEKWGRGAYLSFDIERLLVETTQSAMRNYFALFYLLISRTALESSGKTPLMQQLEEESYKNAYAVTQDLKKGVVAAVEALANEAIWYIKQTPSHKYYKQDETDDKFESLMRDDCLVFIYRLLFVFYAESRPDLDILPINDQTYQRGYSLEMLRDLEQVNLITDEERNGYFFDSSMKRLFGLIRRGYNEDRVDSSTMTASFRVRHIDSPLFSDGRLKVLGGVRFRNVVWQSIICSLSLSQQQKGKARGRISYANLGINQLGSVYENLLAYRGFYAEEDYIEVHPEGDTEETYLQPRSRRDTFREVEIVKDADGRDVIHPRGEFVYRLNGRDRKRSASFYTPEVLTKSTVKYTLRGFVERLERGEMRASELLELKILEPAMGAAAFQNEAINQIAVLYLNFRKREVGRAIDPLLYPQELQKVKAYIATNNVYGVDLNATAIELGKLSLWLNVMHRDMEVPFFSNRLAQGNAVIGAWLRVYKQTDVVRSVVNGKAHDKRWWEATARRVSFAQGRPDRHYTEVYQFLLPMPEMLGALSAKPAGISPDEEARRKEQKRAMTAIRAGWAKGISTEEYHKLTRISRKVDALLKKHVEFQMGVAEHACNAYHVWEYEGQAKLPFKTNAEREEFDDMRYRRSSPYMKLKMAMDYWCALFFWECADAADLPSRQEFWDDVERMLDIDTTERSEAAASQEAQAPQTGGEADYDAREAESEVKAKTVSEMLAEAGGWQTGRLQMEGLVSNNRYGTVRRLADRYHFFHPMLEFLEVFWTRDGFDVVCGNPPWVKLEFNEADIVAEKFPEVAVRRMAAPAVRKGLADFFCQDDERHVEGAPRLRDIYRAEENENAGSTAFLGAKCNYPLLVGQKANLYKCVLTNAMEMASPDNGYIGLLTPEGIYDDPNGQPLRRELYKRLRYHFQYQNFLLLFAEVDPHTTYGDQLLGPSRSSSPDFVSISNLFTPATVDDCFAHRGAGECGGIKTADGKWNTAGHRDRIVHFSGKELQVLSDTFEDGTTGDCARLVRLYSKEVIEVLEKLSDYPTHVRDKACIISTSINETNGVDKGIMRRQTCVPDIANYEAILSAPHFHVANPCYKEPRRECKLNSDYDTLDLTAIPADFAARVNYVPAMPTEDYKRLFRGFQTGVDSDGKPIYGSWLDNYKLAFREMVDPSSEWTLICAVAPCATAHINTVISVEFLDRNDCVDMAAFCQNIVMDFYVKTVGAQHLSPARMQSLPLGVPAKYRAAMYSRTLLLNCLTSHYAELWRTCWRAEYAREEWSVADGRLKPFGGLTAEWERATPLRNAYERRMAMVELDVLAAMALGLSLRDLEMMYAIQFPVLQQNEADTWYDARGRIVFTRSQGLAGVGCGRKEWEALRGEAVDENTFAGAAPTYTATVDPQKSELYGGRRVEYAAPYTRCDRAADYRRAWAHFARRLGE